MALPNALNLYWQSTAPGPATVPLIGETSADVVIVGGGYTGLSSALHLAERGLKPLVLEAHDLAHGCSGRNGGQVNPGLKVPPDQLEADHGRDLGGRMFALSQGAPDEVFDLIERLEIDCSPIRSGTLRAAINPSSQKGEEDLFRQLSRRGIPVESLDAFEMARETGSRHYVSGLLDPRGGHINPLAYARGIAAAALRAGARIHAFSPAQAIERQGADWKVRTPAGTVTAPHAIICTNGYTDDLWPGLRRTIIPVTSAIIATDPLPPALLANIMPSRSSVYEIGWNTVYYRVDHQGRLLMGGRSSGKTSGEERTGHLVSHAERLWPSLKGVAWPWRWSGQVALTIDHYPHLTEPEAGLHLMLGYNGRGVAMATLTGRLLAERIATGATQPFPMPVDARLRPIPFHGLHRIGVEARILYGRLRDAFGV